MTTLDKRYDELELRREDKRLQAEIVRLKAIPKRGALIAGLGATVIMACIFPLTLVGLLGALVVSFLTGFVAMGVLYLLVDEDILWYKERRAALKRPQKATNTAA